MKRIVAYMFFCIFSLIALSNSYAESVSIYNTGHFSIEVPTTWYSEINDGILSFSAEDINKNSRYRIVFSEKKLDIGTLENRELYAHLISDVVSDGNKQDVSFETITIDNEIAMLVSYNLLGNAFYEHYIVFYKDGYSLCVLYINDAESKDDARQSVLNLSETIRFIPDFPLSDEEKINCAAIDVYGKELISSRAGKYPTIDVQEYGSADEIRVSTNQKAFQFLKNLREYRDTVGIEFQDVRINVFTDVMDVYGDVSVKQVLGFNISSEDIDKINFEKMPVENIPKIAFNWYETEAMK